MPEIKIYFYICAVDVRLGVRALGVVRSCTATKTCGNIGSIPIHQQMLLWPSLVKAPRS